MTSTLPPSPSVRVPLLEALPLEAISDAIQQFRAEQTLRRFLRRFGTASKRRRLDCTNNVIVRALQSTVVSERAAMMTRLAVYAQQSSDNAASVSHLVLHLLLHQQQPSAVSPQAMREYLPLLANKHSSTTLLTLIRTTTDPRILLVLLELLPPEQIWNIPTLAALLRCWYFVQTLVSKSPYAVLCVKQKLNGWLLERRPESRPNNSNSGTTTSWTWNALTRNVASVARTAAATTTTTTRQEAALPLDEEDEEEENESEDDDDDDEDDEEYEKDDDEIESVQDEDDDNDDNHTAVADATMEDDEEQQQATGDDFGIDFGYVEMEVEEELRPDEDDEDDEESPSSEPPPLMVPKVASPSKPSTATTATTTTTTSNTPSVTDRHRMLVQASLQVLCELYPLHQPHQRPQRLSFWTVQSEVMALEAMNRTVKPPKELLQTKIILRRAPTQEEFFRGALLRNPIPLSLLQPDASYEPTVADLRRHIANDLQMSDSAELIEILVANKILDTSLKLRVVHQTVWRNHLLEQGSSGSGSGSSLFALSERRLALSAETPLSLLPAMIATYRLAGVDGEATEDAVQSLVDPEEPNAKTPEELETLMEQEYGLTRFVTRGRGIFVLLRSIQFVVMDVLRRIRRDAVSGDTAARERFQSSPPTAGLTFLRHCVQLPSNRRLLLQARAPTILLTLLLDVLKVVEDGGPSGSAIKSSPTADMLKELIEALTSDISNNSTNSTDMKGCEDTDADASSMPLLLESIETIPLSPPLRHVIAKLLPFLTYGQSDLSYTLAQHFDRNIPVDKLGLCENESDGAPKDMLMNTFVETAISLPPNDVCNSLREELVRCGFIDRLTAFISKEMPNQPPPWSLALWSRGEQTALKKGRRNELEDAWREYFIRPGIRTAFRILAGLCKRHASTQKRVASMTDFIKSCHWIETTSDNLSLQVQTNRLGLLSETLIDELLEGNENVAMIVDNIRKQTRLRKKELADERRNQALNKMSEFGPLAGSALSPIGTTASTNTVRGTAASILAPVLGLFRDTNPSDSAASSTQKAPARASRSNKAKEKSSSAKPAWLAEMEAMEDDVGLTCAVCQEGRTLQPSELLGLYGHVRKVSLPVDECGSREGIEGISLLKALPSSMPDALVGDGSAEEWYLVAKTAYENLPSSYTETSVPSKKSMGFVTTVSAGNAIHFSCHRKARLADRNHRKAPKSEWEGAILRNSRVNCNVILPLVSSRSSKVPLMAVDSALTDYQAQISNLLGSPPKSMLWSVLHDVRLLLLRMAYGEPLNADCGGGSLASNCQLVFYQLLMVNVFDRDAQVDQPYMSQHARALPNALLAASATIALQDAADPASQIVRGIADAAPMAALNCVAFHNSPELDGADEAIDSKPPAKRLWVQGKEFFLRGLLIAGGRRHALGVQGSGCQTSRGLGRARSSSFADWEIVGEDNDEEEPTPSETVPARPTTKSRPGASRGRQAKPSIEDFQNALRPTITLFAILDQLSTDFTLRMDDTQVEESAQRLSAVVEQCRQARNIHELLEIAKITFDNEEMIALLHNGMISA